MSPLRWLWTLLLLTVGLAVPARAQQPADTDGDGGLIGNLQQAADPLVRMKARIVGDGLVRDGEWATMHVRLANLGEPLRGQLVLRTRTSSAEDLVYTRMVELPAGARKDVRLLFKPGIGSSVRRVDFLAGTRSLAAEVPVRFLDQHDVLIGVIGEDTAGLQIVRETWGGQVPSRAPTFSASWPVGSDSGSASVATGLIPLAEVPDRTHGLDAFNWLVWLDADPTRLSPEQVAAVRGYVAGGGHLLLTVSDTWRQVGQGPLGELLPVTLSGVEDGGASAEVAAIAGVRAPAADAPQAVATLRPAEGRVVEAIDDPSDGVAWAAGTYGLGTVHVLTVDPRLPPLGAPDFREEVWRHLLWLPPRVANTQWFADQPISPRPAFPERWELDSATPVHRASPALLHAMGLTASSVAEPSGFGQSTDPTWFTGLFAFLQDIPGVAPIPMPWLLGFAAVYLLVIGPGDYLLLKLLDRQPLTWITFPLHIAVFSVVALVGVSYVKGSQAVVTRYELVDALPGTELWRGASWYGVWSTRRTDLALQSGMGDGIAEVLEDKGYRRDLRVRHSTGPTALQWGAETWTLSHARTTWTAPAPGRITISRVGDDLQVVNETDVDLVDVFVAADGGTWDVGDLPAGATRRGGPSGGFAGPLDYPDEALELTEARPWALRLAQDLREVRRGHLDPTEFDAVLYGIAPSPVEPSVLEGLQPVPRTLTVVRVPVRDLDGP